MQLDHEDIAAIAASLANLLSPLDSQEPTQALVTAHELARNLGVSRSWVYAHKKQLGAIPVGEGSRPRLRFDLAAARAKFSGSLEAAAAIEAANSKPRRSRPRPRVPDDVVLIRGRSGR